MKKITLILVIMAMMVVPVFAGGQQDSAADSGKTEIALIIKATDSGFWQKVIEGGEAFDAENPDVKVTIYGPASEADVEEAIGILENVVESRPDAIVIASNAGEGAVPAVNNALSLGIPVITVDTKIPTDVTSHLATDNVLGGKLAADAMVAFFDEYGIEKNGTVAIVAAVAGVDTIIERDGGFIDQLKILAPDIKILDPRYVNNDIAKSLMTTEDLITTYDDLIGIYADNNHTGDGVAKAIEQAELKDKIMVVAFDDDEDEIIALGDGVIKTLIIQDQFNMGYSGCAYALKAINGETLPKFVDTGVKVTKKEDL
ncbi:MULTISPECIES: ABC transporter substrate-binding protein [unclassified Oceanispirochaeta]|uniref:ABC transporter substrate-binding protein n=1 Tax=unclassified Oceanispirochaeta TaxID=2635722 RepID=UPI000E096117|nr:MULTISPECIES: ABC transporter substrate-binding protein [unclassified Oceanispirochaeta]MBF9016691.1 ABC transporter substrate-binding protein [Oceanispirochaeta sp. M2]NPD73104.1 substrate-binding domain-containing protein [Oceanispirochaeta sp. M1]RDG31206.1 LacI family transcriptional regulator [Oceanispirochaeta sp. M1]